MARLKSRTSTFLNINQDNFHLGASHQNYFAFKSQKVIKYEYRQY